MTFPTSKLLPMGVTRTLGLTMVLCLFVQGSTSKSAQEIVQQAPKAMETILEKDLERHATEIASDANEGRLTGTPGQVKAAEYFRDRFKKLGLKPWGDKLKRKKAKDWYQRWPVTLFGRTTSAPAFSPARRS